METKKSKKANLEKGKFAIVQIGLAVACTLTLVAFEWQGIETHIEKNKREAFAQEEIPELNLEIIDKKKEEEIIEPQKQQKKHKVIQKIVVTKLVESDSLSSIDETKFEVVGEGEKETKGQEGEECPECDDDLGDETIEIGTVDWTETMPEFKGFKKYLAQNIKYPRIDVAAGNEGTVYVQFVINKFGEVKDAKIIRGISPTLDAEALRVVKKMPNWTPGETAGVKMNVRLKLPIKFELSH